MKISFQGFDDTLSEWMNFILATYTDVYFVTEVQVQSYLIEISGNKLTLNSTLLPILMNVGNKKVYFQPLYYP